MHTLVIARDRSRVLRVAAVLLCGLATALSARVAIPLPFTPVPLTLQVLVVLLSGLVLGARGGFLAQAAYLQMILLGAPLTAAGLGGPAAFVSPTAGYLWAFPVAAALAGLVVERYGRSLGVHLLAGLAGLGAIYAGGLVWLTVYTGSLQQAWRLGVVPFVVADALKVTLAGSLLAASRR
ncbi:MAG: biotin transporter BioY [Anaerolineae bacterium]